MLLWFPGQFGAQGGLKTSYMFFRVKATNLKALQTEWVIAFKIVFLDSIECDTPYVTPNWLIYHPIITFII